MGSPSRFGSCRDLSPEKDNGWTPNKTGPNYRFSTDPEREDKNDGDNVEEEDDQGTAGGAAGRKKRLRYGQLHLIFLVSCHGLGP